jgi:hypothetical protein
MFLLSFDYTCPQGEISFGARVVFRPRVVFMTRKAFKAIVFLWPREVYRTRVALSARIVFMTRVVNIQGDVFEKVGWPGSGLGW